MTAMRVAATCGVLLAALSVTPAAAEADGWRHGAVAKARMAAAGRGEDGALWAVVEVAAPEGWRTYWRWPGQTGVPPRFDWSGSENADEIALVWPAPEPFESFGHVSWGYDGGMLLAVSARPLAPQEASELRLALSIGVCAEICVPERFELEAALGETAEPWAERLRRQALTESPGDAMAAGLELVECAAERGPDGARIGLRAQLPQSLRSARPVAAPPDGAWFEAIAIELDGRGRLEIEAETRWASAGPRGAPDLSVLLRVQEGDAVAFDACPE